MLPINTSLFSGEKFYLRKFCLIIIFLALISVQSYAQNGWTQLTNMPTARSGACACVVDNKIYVIGGYVSVQDLAVNEVYDPLTNAWQTKSPLPQARGFLSCAVVDGIIYAIGGGYPTATKRVDAYNPTTDTWTRKADLPNTWRSGRTCTVDGIIYLVGGHHGDGLPSSNCEAYNPATDTWTPKASMPAGEGGYLAADVYDGSIYTFGGSDMRQPWTPFEHVFSYNPLTDSWVQKQNMEAATLGHQAFTIGNKTYVIGGGISNTISVGTLAVYYPDLDIWESRANMPVSNMGFAGAVINSKIYVIGGTQNGSTMLSQTWEYDPLLDNTETPVELISFVAKANGKAVTLSWTTATELNNQGFEVQRKFGSGEFVTVGSVKGHGTTTSPNQYSYIDKLVDPGKYFYRLKQMDFGGKYEYSRTVEVNWSPFTTYKLEQNYPNPFNPITTIGFGIPEKGNVRLSVLNILGEEIRVLMNEEREAGYHSVDFDASGLPSGVYMYRLFAGNFIETRKMILLR